MKDFERSINWVDQTSLAIRSRCPELAEHSRTLTVTLTCLFLSQLPSDICEMMMELLPIDLNCSEWLQDVNKASGEIHFPDFIEQSRGILLPERLDHYSQLAAEAFLWAVIHDLPPELKNRMHDLLPLDLRSRMNLYSGYSDEVQVA